MMERPELATMTLAEEFRRWYWLKEELIDYCRSKGIKTTGGKFTIADRIAHYLSTGQTAYPGDKASPKTTSMFNWATEPLSLDTVITDSYRNGPNMRRFMIEQVGPRFRFSIAFMDWMQHNVGKTLRDAIAEWHRLEAQKRDPNYQSVIPPHNQYNRYTREFLADNPDKTIKDSRRYWKLKRALPEETVYARSDLALTEE